MAGPLSGRRVLVTRAKAQASALSEQIRAAGGEPVELAVIRIAPPDSWEPLDAAIERLAEYRWLVLTSANGVESFVSRLPAPGALPPGLRVAAVGSATARALAAAGIRVDLIPPEYRGAALPGAMAPLLAPGDRVLMPRGDMADPALAERLAALGAVVDDVVAYRTLTGGPDDAAVIAALESRSMDYVTFTSSSTVTGLLQVVGGPARLAGARIACIGPETAKAAQSSGLTVHLVAKEATVPGLVAALIEDAARRP